MECPPGHSCATWSPPGQARQRSRPVEGHRRRHARGRVGRRRRVPAQHARGPPVRRRQGEVGGGLLLRRAAAEERPYWEEYFDLVRVQDAHDREPVPRPERRGAVGMLRVRLHGAAGGEAGGARERVSSRASRRAEPRERPDADTIGPLTRLPLANHLNASYSFPSTPAAIFSFRISSVPS